jgi:predicted NAD-dependent protein-ADP-ribosyltransferase YbiA (DUF1768 family)
MFKMPHEVIVWCKATDFSNVPNICNANHINGSKTLGKRKERQHRSVWSELRTHNLTLTSD